MPLDYTGYLIFCCTAIKFMPKNKNLIAIVGMPGSGKTQATKYLIKKLNCPKVYFGEATFDRLKKEGLKINYTNEKKVREKIRSELGMGAYAILALPKIKKHLKEKWDYLAIGGLNPRDSNVKFKIIYFKCDEETKSKKVIYEPFPRNRFDSELEADEFLDKFCKESGENPEDYYISLVRVDSPKKKL